MKTKTINIHDILHIETANTPFKRALGLMYRKNLDNDCGMLFVFPSESSRSFWMKDTHIPLSIAYITSNGIITNIENMEPLSTDGVKSKGPCKYALEVNQGWFESQNIKPGDRVIL